MSSLTNERWDTREARELEASERRFRVTFEMAPVGIAHVALDGSWLRLNPAYCSLLGYDHDELMSLRFQDVTHQDDLEADADMLHDLLTGSGDARRMEKRYVRKDGRIVWVGMSASLVRDERGEPEYFLAAAQDITAERTMREQLGSLSRASALLGTTLDMRQTLRNVARSAVPAIADWCCVDLVEPGGEIGDFIAVAHRDEARVELVHELRRLFPLREDAGIGKVLKTGEPELTPDVNRATLQQIGLDSEQIELLLQVGIRSFLVVPMKRRGHVLGALSLAHAESGRRFSDTDIELATELARRAAFAVENARLYDQSARAIELRDRTLGIVSHDLRNPMFTINLSADLLLHSQAVRSDPKALERVQIIQRNVQRATRLIGDLLDVSSIEAGKLSLSCDTHDVEPIVAEALQSHEPLAQRAHVDLRSTVRLRGARLLCDRDRILAVLGNLLGNALKFCREGDRVEFRAERDARQVLLSVVDTGPGIPAEDLDHIFDPYRRGRSERQGTGLGLFIAKGIVESHRGHIWVESRPGHGSSFHVALPLLT